MQSRRNRKHKVEEHENHERWLVSYADFITLLFAFFVVMYALSSVNEGKYKVASESIKNALSNKTSIKPTLNQIKTVPQHKMNKSVLLDRFKPILNDKYVVISESDTAIELEIKAETLFAPGQAELSEPNAIFVIQQIADVLKDIPNEISIQGHTDNTPINSMIYQSNWELSSARASSVAKLLIHDKVNPTQISVVGYAEFKPKVLNDTSENKAKNRRVTLIIKK